MRDEARVGPQNISSDKFFFLFQSFNTRINSQNSSQSCMKTRVLISLYQKLLLMTIEIPVNLQILAFKKAILMHADDDISYFIDDLLMWLVIFFVGREFRREKEFTRVTFFYLYGLIFSESIISKTHHG